MFRFEVAVLRDFCNPTCTSILAIWNISRGKKQIEPDEIPKFLFTKDTYMKNTTQEALEKRKSKAKVNKTLRVMTDNQFVKFNGVNAEKI